MRAGGRGPYNRVKGRINLIAAEKKKLKFSRSVVFHMKTRAALNSLSMVVVLPLGFKVVNEKNLHSKNFNPIQKEGGQKGSPLPDFPL